MNLSPRRQNTQPLTIISDMLIPLNISFFIIDKPYFQHQSYHAHSISHNVPFNIIRNGVKRWYTGTYTQK